MSKKEAPLVALEDFLPKGSYLMVEPFLLQYNVHLTIMRSRKTLLEDNSIVVGIDESIDLKLLYNI
jgi:hypothetical protein